MACKYICDGCGKQAPANFTGHNYLLPHGWFQRGDKDGMQDACSRQCIDRIARKTGKTALVLPQ